MLYKEKAYQIYLAFLQTVLDLAIIWWANDYFALRVNKIVCILYGVIFGALVYFFANSKNKAVRFIVLLSLLPSVGLIFLIARVNPYLWVKDIINWCIEYNGTTEAYRPVPAYTVLAAAALSGSILLYILVKRIIIRFVLAWVIFIVFLVFSTLKINLDKVVVGVGIFYILCSIIEVSGILYSKKTKKQDKKESILYLLPVCLLLTVISVGLPSKPEPIQWTAVKRLYNTIRNQIDIIISEWEYFTGKSDGIFSISLSGYSEDGSLDNKDLKSSDRIVLQVSGGKGLSSLYLTGMVNDTYTGYSWEKSSDIIVPDEQEYVLDYAELLYGLSKLDIQAIETENILKARSADIYYKNIRTRTLFYPAKTHFIEVEKKDSALNTEQAGITFAKVKKNKTFYSVSYFEINLQDQHLQDLLRTADNFEYENPVDANYQKIIDLAERYYIKEKDTFILKREDIFEIFRKRADIIQEKYTQLPDNLPERVKDLAIVITRDKANNYDKLKAIEAFLLQYTYSLSPGSIPEGWDFVDYFLFENKKGYCTSFATAMAVLARCVGIPSRYVQGYLVDYSDRDDGGYIVRNKDAHAWVEAYFEGIGWIPFEPTPQFYESRYTTWPSYINKVDYSSYYYNRNMAEARLEENPLKTIDSKENNEKNDDIIIWILTAAAVIIILIGVMLCYYMLLRYKYWKEYKRADYSIKMYMLFIRILIMLKYEGFSLRKNETLLMLGEKVKDVYRYNNIQFKDVAEVYMAYRYGGIPVSNEQFEMVERFYEGLTEYRNSKVKKFKHFLLEYLFLIKRNSLNIIS